MFNIINTYRKATVKQKVHPVAPGRFRAALPVTTAMQRQKPLTQAISVLCLHTSFILHIAAVA